MTLAHRLARRHVQHDVETGLEEARREREELALVDRPGPRGGSDGSDGSDGGARAFADPPYRAKPRMMIRVRIELSSIDEGNRLTGTADGVRATVEPGGSSIALEGSVAGEALSTTLWPGSLGAAIARGDELALALTPEHAALAVLRAGDLRFALGGVEDLGRVLGVEVPAAGGYTRVDLKQGTAIARREVIAGRDALAFWLGHFVGGRRP